MSKYNETGQECYWNDFVAGEHVGTHIDAPVHWFTGKNTDSVGQIPMKNMIGEAYVIDIREKVRQNPDYCLTVKIEAT